MDSGNYTNGVPDAGAGPAESQPRVDTVVDAARDQAAKVGQKGAEVTSQAIQTARTQAKTAVDSQKNRAAAGLTHVADAFRSSGQQLSQQGHPHLSGYAQAAADQVGNVSNYLQSRSVDDVLHDAEDLARREPALFLGGVFALGLIAGRFLRSSTSRTMESQGAAV